MAHLKTTYRKPGQTCAVRIEPLALHLTATLRLEVTTRGSGARTDQVFATAELRAGVRWVLLPERTYRLYFRVVQPETRRDDCRIFITFFAPKGAEKSFFDGVFRARDGEQSWQIRTWSGESKRASGEGPGWRRLRWPGGVRPLRDRIIVKRIEAEEQVRGGIIIPDAAKEKPQQAEVIAIGPGKHDDSGGRSPLGVKAGDRVLIGKFSGSEIPTDPDLIILREDEVLAVIDGALEPEVGESVGVASAEKFEDEAWGSGSREGFGIPDPGVEEDYAPLDGLPSNDRKDKRRGGSASVEPPARTAESYKEESSSGALGDDVVEDSPPLVNSGFVSEADPVTPIDPRDALIQQARYYFWFEIGEPVEGAIQGQKAPIKVDDLPPRAKLQVALFSFEGEIGIESGRDIGTLEFRPDRSIKVLKGAAAPPPLAGHELLSRRLFFPVLMPRQVKTHRLRCNIYYRQVLLQSHLVSVEVILAGSEPQRSPALSSVLDFQISELMRTELLANIREHRLSVMLNENGNGTHGFRFYGSDSGELYKRDATIPEGELTTTIHKFRARLRAAMWGDEESYAQQTYRYQDGRRNLERLRGDLIDLGKFGRRFYGELSDKLAGRGSAIEQEKRRLELLHLLRTPGRIQIVSKDSLRHVVPTALFFDYELAENLRDYRGVKLCAAFERSLDQQPHLADTPCFQGECPDRDDPMVVCPGGFWGFRHDVGCPRSVSGDHENLIAYSDRPRLLMSVWRGNDFKQRQGHETEVKGLVGDAGWTYADTYAETMSGMQADAAQIVYFYCHGGLTDDVPYLQIGTDAELRVITKDALRAVFFSHHRPLVFINGCHTTQLDPEKALDLVTGFLNRNAVGVIGTETTIFEPLACAFGEAFLRRFLDGTEAGRAIRMARLDLLKKGNPLGLVYIPFVLSSTRLMRRRPPLDEPLNPR